MLFFSGGKSKLKDVTPGQPLAGNLEWPGTAALGLVFIHKRPECIHEA